MAAMFSKEAEDTQVNDSTAGAKTVIGPTVKVEGTFESEDNILIEGEVVGTVSTSKDLTVGKDARLKADVSAANMNISGEVHGNLNATGTIELASTARIQGDMKSTVLTVESGASVNGQCTTGESASQNIEDAGEETSTNMKRVKKVAQKVV